MGRGVQRIETLIQIDADRIARIEWPSDGDQNLRKVGVDSPIASFVGIGQRRARYLAAESHVVELAADGTLSMFRIGRQARSKTSFSFQIVFTPNRMHHIETIWLACSLRKFPRTAVENIIGEVKRHSYYLKPGEKHRVKQALARKRARKKIRKDSA